MVARLAAGPGDAALARGGRRPPRRARLAGRPHDRPLRGARRRRVRRRRARDARVRGGGGRHARARRHRARVLLGRKPRRRPARGDAAVARRVLRRFLRRRARARRGAARAPARGLAPDALRCSRSSPACRSHRPSGRSTRSSTARRRAGPRRRRSRGSATAVSIGIAAGSAVAGVLVDERGVRWAFGLGAAVALAGAPARLGCRGTLEAPAAAHRSEPSRLPSRRAPVAQWTERRTSNPRVGGSNPPGRIKHRLQIGCLDERIFSSRGRSSRRRAFASPLGDRRAPRALRFASRDLRPLIARRKHLRASSASGVPRSEVFSLLDFVTHVLRSLKRGSEREKSLLRQCMPLGLYCGRRRATWG